MGANMRWYCCADCRSQEDVPLRLHFQCLPFAELVLLSVMSGRSAAAALDARRPPQTTHACVYLRLICSVFRVGNPILDYQPISSFLRHFRFVRFLLPTPYRVFCYYTTNGLFPSPAESASVSRSKSRRHPNKLYPATTTNSPAMVAMPTTARSDRIMVIGFVCSM